MCYGMCVHEDSRGECKIPMWPDCPPAEEIEDEDVDDEDGEERQGISSAEGWKEWYEEMRFDQMREEGSI